MPPYRRRGGTPAPTSGAAPTSTANGWSRRRSQPASGALRRRRDAHDLGLRIGDDVEHPAFGEGVIIELRGQGESAEATVHFAGVGTKHLALAFAPLRKRSS